MSPTGSGAGKNEGHDGTCVGSSLTMKCFFYPRPDAVKGYSGIVPLCVCTEFNTV